MRSSIFVLMLATIFLLGASTTQPVADSSKPAMVDDPKGRTQMLAAEYDRAVAERDEAAKAVASLRAKIYDQSGWVDVSAEGLRAVVQKLEEQKEQLLLEEAGSHGRKDRLSTVISQYSQMARQLSDSDPVVAELTKVVPLREKELARLQQLNKIAAVSPSEVSAAEMALAQARADVATAKQRAAGGAGFGEALQTWNREMENLSIDGSDREARLQYLSQRLQQLHPAVALLPDLEQALAELESARATVIAARNRLEQVRDFSNWLKGPRTGSHEAE